MILEDVAHIYDLPVDGQIVTEWTNSSYNFLVNYNMAIFGNEPSISSSGVCMALKFKLRIKSGTFVG
ncbi:hypothetical protein AHAS_Ahas11G0075900 [Arachis hypogaea]